MKCRAIVFECDESGCRTPKLVLAESSIRFASKRAVSLGWTAGKYVTRCPQHPPRGVR